MVCLKCGVENYKNRLYCSECGNTLAMVCQCSFVNAPEDKYCGGCGVLISNRNPNGLHSEEQNVSHSLEKQLSENEIDELIKESAYYKFEKGEGFDQDDINMLFQN